MRKIPMRKCVITNERFPKNELIRVVRTPEGEIVVDPTGRKNGHGAYLRKDLEVIATARKKKTLNRILETEIPDSVYDELEKLI
ncbi:MAG: YlxR family protein [Erysipelotrichaceae bacterium]|nr:YlxR family protein [Erysipelotrichaceae bacterium]MBR2544600.1 YlxR family protein [Erysipelotrichaceae bacterium]